MPLTSLIDPIAILCPGLDGGKQQSLTPLPPWDSFHTEPITWKIGVNGASSAGRHWCRCGAAGKGGRRQSPGLCHTQPEIFLALGDGGGEGAGGVDRCTAHVLGQSTQCQSAPHLIAEHGTCGPERLPLPRQMVHSDGHPGHFQCEPHGSVLQHGTGAGTETGSAGAVPGPATAVWPASALSWPRDSSAARVTNINGRARTLCAAPMQQPALAQRACLSLLLSLGRHAAI